MEYCGPRGIPLSVFLGWDDDDQDAALEWQARAKRRCPSCGTHPDDWNPDAGGRRDAYRGEVVICPGCQQLGSASERHEKSGVQVHGAHTVLIANPSHLSLAEQE